MLSLKQPNFVKFDIFVRHDDTRHKFTNANYFYSNTKENGVKIEIQKSMGKGYNESDNFEKCVKGCVSTVWNINV